MAKPSFRFTWFGLFGLALIGGAIAFGVAAVQAFYAHGEWSPPAVFAVIFLVTAGSVCWPRAFRDPEPAIRRASPEYHTTQGGTAIGVRFAGTRELEGKHQTQKAAYDALRAPDAYYIGDMGPGETLSFPLDEKGSPREALEKHEQMQENLARRRGDGEALRIIRERRKERERNREAV